MITKWLNETNFEEIELVGGKNASLGEMIQNLSNLGIKIPNGFLVTSNGYDDYMKHNNLYEKINHYIKNINIDDNEDLKAKGLLIRKYILEGEIHEDLKKEIIEKYRELSLEYNLENVDVAVRSSGTAEDMPDASFAGQQDTYLNVRNIENIFDCVKKMFCFII